MELSETVSNRISMLRPLLIIGVLFVHVGGVSYISAELGPGFFQYFAGFFKNAFFRGTVPTMSLISGYLLFASGIDRTPGQLYKKKFTTLAIPFIVFNLYAFAFMLGINAVCGPVFPVFATFQNDPKLMLSTMVGLTGAPINGPLHFVRDMMVAIALVPVLGAFLRHRPWLGLTLLIIIFGTNMDGVLIFRASSLILFYVGGAAAIYKWNLLALDEHAKLCLGIFIVACLGIIAFRVEDKTVLITAAPFLIWPAASLLQGTKIESWAIHFCKYSFFIFVAHMPIIDSLWWGVSQHARWIPYPLFWFAAPFLTVCVLKWTYDTAMRFAPKSFNFMIGARALKPKFVDRRRVHRPVNAPVYSIEMRSALTSS